MPTARRILETPRDCSTGGCADPMNPVLAESAEIEWPGIGMTPNEREGAFGDDHSRTLTDFKALRLGLRAGGRVSGEGLGGRLFGWLPRQMVGRVDSSIWLALLARTVAISLSSCPYRLSLHQSRDRIVILAARWRGAAATRIG